ncbi:MAG: NAD+ synthetase, partial [Emticicia sp.]
VSYVYANLLGNEAGRAIYDGGALIANNGSLLAIGERLSFKDFDVTTAIIDLNLTRLAQIQMHSFDALETQGSGIEVPFDYPEIKPQANLPQEAH